MRVFQSTAISDLARAPAPLFTVLNSTRQTIIASCVQLAETPRARRVGLLKHERLEWGQGLYIPGRKWLPLMAIHTYQMKFSINAFFLDNHNRVVALFAIPPNRIACVFGARGVLETAEGIIVGSQTQLGDEIELRQVETIVSTTGVKN